MKEKILLSKLEYDVIELMLKKGIFSIKELSKIVNKNYRSVSNTIIRVLGKYKVKSLTAFVYKYLKKEIPQYELRSNTNQSTKRQQKAIVIDFSPEEIRRTKLMKKMGFSEAEILKELRE